MTVRGALVEDLGDDFLFPGGATERKQRWRSIGMSTRDRVGSGCNGRLKLRCSSPVRDRERALLGTFGQETH